MMRMARGLGFGRDDATALMRVCEDFGVRIGTFQHVLEGYKVAEAMHRHGAGGSTFSDWWAFKVEVYDAIPHNGGYRLDMTADAANYAVFAFTGLPAGVRENYCNFCESRYHMTPAEKARLVFENGEFVQRKHLRLACQHTRKTNPSFFPAAEMMW